MTRLCVRISQLLLALVFGLQVARAADTEMIVGGTPAPEGKYPWEVRLYKSMDDAKGFCGGTLISKQWVLTAAHCAVVDNKLTENLVPVDQIVVGYGSVDRTKTTKVESEKIKVNPQYLEHGSRSSADVALIEVRTAVDNVVPVEIADTEADKKLVTPGATVTVTGWGAIWNPEDKDILELLSILTAQDDLSDKLKFPLKLHEVDIQVMDRDECRSIYQASQLGVADTELCALKPRSASNSCYGDSGGPLVVLAKNPKRYVQVGVVSWGDRCGRVGYPNVFARVSSFSDWIYEVISSN